MFLPANITLKFGDSGDFVSELQRRLAAVHCFSTDANGFFDGVTVNGVSAFQSMSGLRADGIAGPETLRRLNGVISGDTSSTNTHQEDQDRLLQEEAARQIAQQEALARQQQHEQERMQAEQLAAERATQEQQWQQAPAAAQQHEMQPAQDPYASLQHAAQQQIMAAEAQMQQHQQMAQPQHTQQQPMAHQMAAPAAQAQAEQHHQQAPQLQQQAHVIPVQQQQAPAQVHVIQPQTAAAAAAAAHIASTQHQAAPQQAVATQTAGPAAEPKGIVGRAMQYANDMVQKLSTYFESKLPAPVIDEVKDIGKTMAKSGVREAAIPTGPEQQQQRGIDGPARGQQQAPQRS